MLLFNEKSRTIFAKMRMDLTLLIWYHNMVDCILNMLRRSVQCITPYRGLAPFIYRCSRKKEKGLNGNYA